MSSSNFYSLADWLRDNPDESRPDCKIKAGAQTARKYGVPVGAVLECRNVTQRRGRPRVARDVYYQGRRVGGLLTLR